MEKVYIFAKKYSNSVFSDSRINIVFGFVCAILMGLCCDAVGQQKITKPVINDYFKVGNIAGNVVTFEGTSTFITGNMPDTVLLIQMTGVTWAGTNVTLNNAGRYEFHIVTAASGQAVTLKSTPGNFDFGSEFVQLIRVPSYKNVQVINTLGCNAWSRDTGTGGVLALMVEETLTLNANIDVSGKGFNGGKVSGAYTGECGYVMPYILDNYTNSEADKSGYKGEGAAQASLLNPTSGFPRGQGPAYNGGGGGNGKYAGGGGGGNGGGGGAGNLQTCWLEGDPTPDNSGFSFKYNEKLDTTLVGVWSERVFMGGGGGTGTGNGTPGGNGGGIVIIVAGEFHFGTGTVIKANGAGVTSTINNNGANGAGAGGGGAGGSILFSLDDYNSNTRINIESNGGKGGDVEMSCTVENVSRCTGGGGGGGLLFTTKDITNLSDWNCNVTGGTEGRLSPNQCDNRFVFPGILGQLQDGLEIQLRGFLYNAITTPDTTVCNNTKIIIRASVPKGGIPFKKGTQPKYSYSWQVSENGTSGWEQLAGQTSQNCTTQLSKTAYLRRVVTSKNETDYGNTIKITVLPETNKISASDTQACENTESLVITGSDTTGGAGVKYSIHWERSINNATWETIQGATNKDLTVTSFTPGNHEYRRIVKAVPPGCFSPSDTAKIKVLPKISNNTITPPNQDLCETKSAATKLAGQQPLSGGAGPGSYTYQWQVKFDDADWTNVDTQEDYLPLLEYNNQKDYRQRFYQRIVTSSVCSVISNEVKVKFDQQSSPSTINTIDETLDYKFSIQLDAVKPTVGIGTWSSSDQNLSFDDPRSPATTAKNLQFGDNAIQWKVENGVCTSTPASVKITVRDVTIPTGFSPNGDGLNDCFRVIGAENAVSSELVVLNRNNNIVYESKKFKGSSELKDCSGWWDGRDSSGKELPSGTYFFQLTLNGDRVYKGYVVLKK